jgi:hypothetical protein
VDPGTCYLELVLRLRRLEPELVSDYFGPEELAARIDAEAPSTATEILGQATALLEQISGAELESARRRWLSAHVRAIHSVCGWLGGEQFGYRELGERCYGIRPAPAPEDSFELAHGMLDDALPGAGDLRTRYQRWIASRRKAWQLLRPVRPNVVMLLDEHGTSRQEAWDYLRTWRLEEDEYIDRTLASLVERRWKPYESCYTDGLALCRQFVRGDPARFQRLLAEPLIPVDLVAETSGP